MPAAGQIAWCLVAMILSSAVSAAADVGAAQAWRRFADNGDAEPARPVPFESCFRQAAAAHELPMALLAAVARGESNFDPDAVSSANARGLMQIQWPGTGRHLGFRRASDLHNPCRNVDAGARYLKELLARYDGDLHLVLAAYNYGPGRIAPDGQDVPAGAEWYSAYIYRHLQYVLGQRGPEEEDREWDSDRQLELAVFRAPYRAAAFVETLGRHAPGLRLDWFRQDLARVRVVLLYSSGSEKAEGLKRLAAAGFPLKGEDSRG
jgi:hypothetical protein